MPCKKKVLHYVVSLQTLRTVGTSSLVGSSRIHLSRIIYGSTGLENNPKSTVSRSLSRGKIKTHVHVTVPITMLRTKNS